MELTIALPSALQPYAGGSTEVVLDARCATVGEVLGALAGRHAGLVDRVIDERGEVRRHVNIFVDGDNIRFLEGLSTAVREGSTIDIFPAVSGG
ncbi:MAG TPA: ubiquitin-like small modifier protein 1 [Longimicrobiaceae bacterium]|nr:ubiquitin-like small modifier protein 1 [Longimicrobiaceae bacterium]